MATNRSYPNIDFVTTDTAQVESELIRKYETLTGRKLYPADPVRLLILWAAAVIVQERVLLNHSARQNVPRFAEGEYLDSLGELFRETGRMEPKPAKTTFRFWLSAARQDQQVIPAGTRVTVDGEITFATSSPLFIEAGKLYGDAEAVCITKDENGAAIGARANGFAPGQITQIVDVYPFYERVENITESAGGSDREGDEAYYNRMRESFEAYSTAGSLGSYEYHAKSASTLVSDVSAVSPEPGVVDVRILLQGGELPTKEVLKEVQAALSDEKVRPLTDLVRVAAPETVPFDIDFTYFIPNPSAASTAVIAQAVTDAVNQYRLWQTGKMGRDINPSRLTSLLMGTGVKRVEVRKPVFQQVEKNSVAILGTETVLNGGAENE